MKVFLVGAGPGDAGLLTIRGAQVLSEADVIVYDALANPSLLEYAGSDAEMIYVGKIAGRHALPQDEINALLVARAKEGKKVARLKGGDPYIFGRGGEEAEYLVSQGIPFEEVPGISSAIAAPAYAGIPLTHRDLTSSVTIITGHEKPAKSESALDWESFAKSGSTLVFVMGMKNLPEITANLMRAGMDPHTPAAVIYRGTTPFQRSLVSTLLNLADEAAAANFTNPAVIVIGKVVGLASRLDWYGNKPLLGKNIVVTRAREQASSLVNSLKELGANAIQCPSIEIRPMSDYSDMDSALEKLQEYGWIIFTSVNGVKYFWQRLEKQGLDSRSLSSARIAAIGPATASALQAKGIIPDLVPPKYVAESVASEIMAAAGHQLKGMKILLPRAAKARMVLPEELSRAGALVTVVSVYETHPSSARLEEIRNLMEKHELDCITFGSSSTVENFLSILPASQLLEHPETALAAIGPITASTLERHGLNAGILPEEFTIPALVKAIVTKFAGIGEK